MTAPTPAPAGTQGSAGPQGNDGTQDTFGRRVGRWLLTSTLAAWTLYATIGLVVSGAVVLVACSGESRSEPAPEPKPKPRKSARAPSPPPSAALPATPPPRFTMYPDLGAAVLALAADKPRVIGVGELHVRTDRPAPGVSALARFSNEVIPALGDRVSDLVVETWTVDPTCKPAAAATRTIEGTMKRPASTGSELGALFGASRLRSIKGHVMRLTCDDLAGFAKQVDPEKLLGLVTRELDRIVRSAVRYRDEHNESRPLILVYGGALHNDLYPYESTKQWSFGLAVDAATSGRYVELDVYAPELVEGDPLYQDQAWYPLVAKATQRGVMLVERAPRSYLAILPRS